MDEVKVTTPSALSPSLRPSWLWGALVLGTAGYFGIFVVYPNLFGDFGVNYFGIWFLDTFAILASNDALALGRDVYAPNPLDYLNRPHVYSRWWLELGRFGLTRADNFWVGLTAVLAFFSAALAGLRPRTAPELVWYFAVLCSSPVLLAVHRANNDLVIFFLLTPVVPLLLSPRREWRLLAVPLIAWAAALKYYPAAAVLVLLAGSNRQEIRARMGLAVLALGAAGVGVFRDLGGLGAMVPKPEGLMTFGAANFFGSLGMKGGVAIMGAGVAGAIMAGFHFRSDRFKGWDLPAADQSAWVHFVLGASLLTGCFFTGTSFAYRWIFAIWMAPFLWKTWHDAAAPARVRRFAVTTATLLVVVLWADTLGCTAIIRGVSKIRGADLVEWANWYFLAEQPFTWAFFACLIGWLVHFARGGARALFNRG